MQASARTAGSPGWQLHACRSVWVSACVFGLVTRHNQRQRVELRQLSHEHWMHEGEQDKRHQSIPRLGKNGMFSIWDQISNGPRLRAVRLRLVRFVLSEAHRSGEQQHRELEDVLNGASQ